MLQRRRQGGRRAGAVGSGGDRAHQVRDIDTAAGFRGTSTAARLNA